jgi:hypothetical protein
VEVGHAPVVPLTRWQNVAEKEEEDASRASRGVGLALHNLDSLARRNTHFLPVKKAVCSLPASLTSVAAVPSVGDSRVSPES